jgi:hypothetical protein
MAARIEGDPNDLILHLADLPPGFSQIADEYDGPNKYAVLYLSPSALDAQDLSEPILAVVAGNLILHEDLAAVEEQYENEEGLDEGTITDSIAGTSGDATLIEVQPYPVRLAGTDQAKTVRVEYTIGPMVLVDYRYRFVMGNAVVNLIATARGVGQGRDTSSVAEQAQGLAERQVERLSEAGR